MSAASVVVSSEDLSTQVRSTQLRNCRNAFARGVLTMVQLTLSSTLSSQMQQVSEDISLCRSYLLLSSTRLRFALLGFRVGSRSIGSLAVAMQQHLLDWQAEQSLRNGGRRRWPRFIRSAVLRARNGRVTFMPSTKLEVRRLTFSSAYIVADI